MLQKVVDAMKADKAKTLKDTAGIYKEKDLVPTAADPRALVTAHPTLMGKSLT